MYLQFSIPRNPMKIYRVMTDYSCKKIVIAIILLPVRNWRAYMPRSLS